MQNYASEAVAVHILLDEEIRSIFIYPQAASIHREGRITAVQLTGRDNFAVNTLLARPCIVYIGCIAE